MTRRRVNPRKLLVASVGVATLNYLPAACSISSTSTVANLLAPPFDSGAGGGAADAAVDAADARPHEAGIPPSPTVANLLLAPPPPQSLPAKGSG